MDPEKKETQTAAGGEWAQIKKGAKFWLPACLALTAILLIFAILLTYVLATEAQRKRDLRTIAEQKREEEEQKQREEELRANNLAILESILSDRAFYGDVVESEDFLQAVFELYKEKSGDRYAVYYTEEEFAIRNSQLSGQTVGIGVTLDQAAVLYEETETPALLIQSVIADSPAQQSGLVPGEWILAIGNSEGELQSVSALGGYHQAILALRGEEETNVFLRVLSGAGEEQSVKTVACVRRAVQSQSVYGYLLEGASGVAVIRIREFSFQTPVQFRAAIEECRAAGATKFILDVRDNPGGSLIALSAVLSGFLQNGDLIYFEKYANGTLNPVTCLPHAYEGEKAGCTVTEETIGQYLGAGLSFAVLCNEKTVSAAELFAATLSQSGVASVYGQKTAGKWVAQSSMAISFKTFKGYISFTVYQCFSKNGVSYQDEGFTPDIPVALAEENGNTAIESLPREQDLQLQAAAAGLCANP